MPQFKVKVKWGKNAYPDVEVNTDESPALFKDQLFELTGVQPGRQKIMSKGATLKDADWNNFKINDGLTLLLMGSNDDIPQEPSEKTLFIEDIEEELASSIDIPAGLTNLGNTCYLNATVQCLKSVPELREALESYEGDTGGLVSAHSITLALKNLYSLMDDGSNVPPIILLQIFQLAYPRFAKKNEHGAFIQQDASECWTEIVRVLQQKLPAKANSGTGGEQFKSFIDQYLGGTFDTQLKCTEAEDEPITTIKEQFLHLSCFITQSVRYMYAGLKLKLQEQITKNSPTLDRDALYTKTSKVSRLPAYLTVQFVRFFYKGRESINAKILKDVKFPVDFDAYDLCTPELQQKLAPQRAKFKVYDDAQTELTALERYRRIGDGRSSEVNKKYAPFSFEDDLGSNNSGYYTLQAVLTHKGRSSAIGHYVAWVRQTEDVWMKCDDDDISAVTTEDILKLSGGGDWHCAYVLLYGPRRMEL